SGRVDVQSEPWHRQPAAGGIADGHRVEVDGDLPRGQMQLGCTRDRHFAVGVVLVKDEGTEHQGEDEGDDRSDHQDDGGGQRNLRAPSATHSRSVSERIKQYRLNGRRLSEWHSGLSRLPQEHTGTELVPEKEWNSWPPISSRMCPISPDSWPSARDPTAGWGWDWRVGCRRRAPTWSWRPVIAPKARRRSTRFAKEFPTPACP